MLDGISGTTGTTPFCIYSDYFDEEGIADA